jgi:hypothetical protein
MRFGHERTPSSERTLCPPPFTFLRLTRSCHQYQGCLSGVKTRVCFFFPEWTGGAATGRCGRPGEATTRFRLSLERTSSPESQPDVYEVARPGGTAADAGCCARGTGRSGSFRPVYPTLDCTEQGRALSAQKNFPKSSQKKKGKPPIISLWVGWRSEVGDGRRRHIRTLVLRGVAASRRRGDILASFVATFRHSPPPITPVAHCFFFFFFTPLNTV